ncbi:Uncharacterised protein [Leminorella richardii]|uniref:Uncharacterized protein n=1 Tax=Leminorella richardii TaxID=158841 RepID=A0A2X4XRI9_9GAMM|nr:Uncharacterised protein [Leminorella richardii]
MTAVSRHNSHTILVIYYIYLLPLSAVKNPPHR